MEILINLELAVYFQLKQKVLPETFTSKKFEKDVYYNPYSTTDNLDPEGRYFFQLLYCCNITLFKKKLYCRSGTIGAFRTQKVF
jgi:hypothetical protein